MTLTNKRVGLATVAAALLAGCGPTAPVNTDVHQAGANVIFGAPSASAAPPQLVYVNPVQSFPAPVEQPPALPPPPAALAQPCPTLSPLSYPAQDASTAPVAPPVAATYPFSYTGTLTTNAGTPSQKVVQLPASGTRQVENVSAVDPTSGAYSYDVAEVFNGIQTTTSFQVYPQGYAGTLPATNGVAPGMYITKVVTVDSADPSKNMTWTTQPAFGGPSAAGLEIFPFPAAPNATWTSTASDPTGATVVVGPPSQKSPSGTATVVDHVRVNACGQAIDAWQATMTGTVESPVDGPNSSTTFTLTIDEATQYGGLIVGDALSESYNDTNGGGQVPTAYAVQSTINVVPSS